LRKIKTGGTSATPVTDEKFTDVQLESDSLKGDQLEDEDARRNIILRSILTHYSGRVRQICVFNTVNLGTSASSP